MEIEARGELRASDPRLAALRAIGFVAAAAFYAGAFLLVFWALDTLRRHETLELLVRERSAGALLERPEPGDDLARRRECCSRRSMPRPCCRFRCCWRSTSGEARCSRASTTGISPRRSATS